MCGVGRLVPHGIDDQTILVISRQIRTLLESIRLSIPCLLFVRPLEWEEIVPSRSSW